MPPLSHVAVLPIERVVVVGCGGNGSIFLTHLCRIWQAWTKLGGKPFKITIYDPDVVSEANLARQCFCAADVGQYKSHVLGQRARAFFDIPIECFAGKFPGSNPYSQTPSVVVGCVDNVETRRQLAVFSSPQTVTRHQWGQDTEEKRRGCYWLDLGNDDHTGQVILGGHGLPNLFDLYPALRRKRDGKDIPSCSMAESLARQDLFINSTIATMAAGLLWSLMRRGGISHHGYVINLTEGIVLPIKV